ncbi:hypothetical protein EDB81DRAFT_252456 [Dactylonectria macrodidyma]|uniref:Uncharacterized protein n=1 Tax=Dactylonectria macrodidyma TaxID=307937 RepID=A0A9P9FL61_9HYPO|nr:hypothetical protein EDB81DRAFT_252456 [Dactylonectria macrodidyma]
MIPSTINTLVLALGVTLSGATSIPAGKPIKPNHESSKENAYRIFNAIHSAGRQWGSSYYHNGFGFIPAVMPRGTLLFHGDQNNTVPTGPEWLAFEIEHAEGFAFSHKGRFRRPPRIKPPGGDPRDPNRPPLPGDDPNDPPPPLVGDSDGQTLLSDSEDTRQELRRRRNIQGPGSGPLDSDDDDDKNVRGYLQTYQANRDLKLLYIDGMSAGKTSMGTLDTQDLLLRENTTNHNGRGFDEYPRAMDLCDLAGDWGFDGVMRMEAGFEIIYCDFNNGLDVISMTRTAMPEDKVGDNSMAGFMWARAVGERYNGLGADRIRFDFSSMVSALFFPVNITSKEIDRPDLVRLESVSLDDLRVIKKHLAKVAAEPRRFTVNWQGVVDLIVSRFAHRIGSMASESLAYRYFLYEVETITATWFDAPPLPEDISLSTRADVDRYADAVDRCRKHFLRPATISKQDWSLEDELIFTSIDTVMEKVCSTLFSIRELLSSASPKPTASPDDDEAIENDDDSGLQHAVDIGRTAIQRLTETLGWTTWMQAQPCPLDEVLFIAMWPFGNVEDHWNPGCRSIEGLSGRGNESYWRMNFGGPRGGPKN